MRRPSTSKDKAEGFAQPMTIKDIRDAYSSVVHMRKGRMVTRCHTQSGSTPEPAGFQRTSCVFVTDSARRAAEVLKVERSGGLEYSRGLPERLLNDWGGDNARLSPWLLLQEQNGCGVPLSGKADAGEECEITCPSSGSTT